MHKENVKRRIFKKYIIALSVLFLIILGACSGMNEEEKTNSSADKDSVGSPDTNGSSDSAKSNNPDDTVDFTEPTDNDNNYGRGAVSDGADTK